jgi:hypothetical protein
MRTVAFTHIDPDLFPADRPHQHDTVAEARDCQDEAEHFAWEIDCDLAAEAAIERHFEDRGVWDPEEDIARAAEAAGWPVPASAF